MESLANLISAISSLSWPLIFAIFLFKCMDPLKKIIESAQGRKFTIKVAGNELTLEEASEQQRQIISDVQMKLGEMEKHFNKNIANKVDIVKSSSSRIKRILWVDDNPKNNSYLASLLEERGVVVDIALNTTDGVTKVQSKEYDVIISDMGRPEGGKAGIDLAKKIKTINSNLPVFIFCGGWAAQNLRQEALSAGVTEITSSGTTLLSLLSV